MDVERSPKQGRCLSILAECHVAESLTRKCPEVIRISGQRFLAIGDSPGVIPLEVTDRCPFVPPFREVGSTLDNPCEQGFGLFQLPTLHRLHPLSEQRIHLRNSRLAPDLPKDGLRPGRHGRVISPDRLEGLALSQTTPFPPRFACVTRSAARPDRGREF